MRNLLNIAIVATVPLLLAGCELGPKTSGQDGYRGTGMNSIALNSSATTDDVPAPPYELPAAGGTTVGEAYENVQVLTNVSEEEFTYLMAAITEWVAPEEGCNYCHNPANLASDEVYQKVVARRMLVMTQALNSSWSSHTGQSGVTCWTCHRGNAVPEASWTLAAASKKRGSAAVRQGQNMATADTAYTSLPGDFAARYLLKTGDADTIRVASKSMHPNAANKLTTMQTEPTYALMNHMSQSLGVNCTFCHNTQSFQSWNQSTPQRATAWHGIRMVADINGNYITPLTSVFPANRLGSEGDPFKVNCATCHRGKNKPLGGAPMVKDYPALKGPTAAAPATVAAETAPAATTAAE